MPEIPDASEQTIPAMLMRCAFSAVIIDWSLPASAICVVIDVTSAS